jgi:glycosyltransferase involved in cell wall biosynthesis
MSARPLVSVIIPAYNCAKYLPEAIESVLNQTYPHVEVIVVNDGSPDNTDEVANTYRRRIIYHKQENKGLSASRNIGFTLSKGELVTFLDADDFLFHTKFEKQIGVFSKCPDAGVVISGYVLTAEDGKKVISATEKAWNGDGFSRLMRHESFPCHAALIRRDVFDRSLRFVEDIAPGEYQEDWQLWIDMALDGVQFYSCPEPLCAYRYRETAGSRNILRHNAGAFRVVQWLRNDPRAQKYARQVDRLEAIVQMERVGRAWRVGEKRIAVDTLAESVAAHGSCWLEPLTYSRLFEHTLSLHESVAWRRAPNIERMERAVIHGILEAARSAVEERNLRLLRSAALLCLADTAYGLGNGQLARAYTLRSLRESLQPLVRPSYYPALARSAVGPKWGGVVGRAMRGFSLT